MPTALMKYCPVTGKMYDQPRPVKDLRESHQPIVWWFNPWTGTKRHELDVDSDPQGELIVSAGEILAVAVDNSNASYHNFYKFLREKTDRMIHGE